MTKQITGLGKGLEAIFETSGISIPTPKSKDSSISMIELTSIEANPTQPRTYFDQEALAELAQSIERLGVIQPITLRKVNGSKYQIISGERRFRAAKIAGLKEVPAYVRIADDEQLLEMALVENIQRENLNAIEVALTFERLMNECSLTQELLADRVGKKRATVANYVRLLNLPAEVQAALRSEIITMGHARALLGLRSENDQLVVLERTIRNSLSVRALEDIVATMLEGKKAKQPTRLPEKYKQFSENFASMLGAKVKISENANGAGKITITFESATEFDQIANKLNK